MAFQHVHSIHGYGLGEGIFDRFAADVEKAKSAVTGKAPVDPKKLKFVYWEREDVPKTNDWAEIQSNVKAVFTDGFREVRYTPKEAAKLKLVTVHEARVAVKALLDRVATPEQRKVIAERLRRQRGLTAKDHAIADKQAEEIAKRDCQRRHGKFLCGLAFSGFFRGEGYGDYVDQAVKTAAVLLVVGVGGLYAIKRVLA